MTDQPAARDAVVIERTFHAPIELVWRMWTDSGEFAAWYGPTGVVIPMVELDVRVGGRRHVCMEMTTPDGAMRMWFGGEFTTVERPTLLVYTEHIADEQGRAVGDSPATEVTVELSALPDGTRMVLTHAGIPIDSPGAAGWLMALDALTDRLAASAV